MGKGGCLSLLVLIGIVAALIYAPGDNGVTPPSTAPPPTQRSANVPAPGVPFRAFKIAFDALNSRIQQKTGVVFFTHAEDRRDGILVVTATDVWLAGTETERKSNLETIYKLWLAANKGFPSSLWIADSSGAIRMERLGWRSQ